MSNVQSSCTSSPLRVTMLVAAALCVGFVSFGCAGASPGMTTGETTDEGVSPFAPDPRLEIEWRKAVDPAGVRDYQPRQFADPVVARGTDRRDIFVGTDAGDIYCLRAGDGYVRWKRDFDGPIHAAPAVNDRQVVVATTHGTLRGLNRSDGSTIWQFEADSGIDTVPTTGRGLALATTVAETVIAVDMQTGEEAWSYSREKPQKFTVKGGGRPTIHEKTAYVGFSDGYVVGLDMIDGSPRWKTDLSAGSNEYVDIVGRIRIYSGRAYAVSYATGLYALDLKDGGVVWRRPFENVSDLELTSDSIYLTIATGRIVAVDTKTGASKWGFSFKSNLPVGISQAGPYLFASTSSGPMYVLDRETGYPFERWRPSNGFGTRVAFSENAGYTLSNGGYLYRFRVAY